jgi:phospholipase/carboxylesterase
MDRLPAVPPSSLEAIVQSARAPSENPPLLVLLHGLGSNEQDLMGFAPMIDPRWTIVAIRAPITYGWGGYAWFDIDLSSGSAIANEDQARASRDALIDYLKDLPKELGTDPTRTTLGGFSQGAMMSLGVALVAPELVSSLLLMSGVLLPAFEREARESQRTLSGIQALVTHGKNDPLLPVSEGRRMHEFLLSVGADSVYHEFSMAHEVNMACLQTVSTWLSAVAD